jgi:hydroxypyruvate reductase
MTIREDAELIIKNALAAARPDAAVVNALGALPRYDGKLYMAAVGKAAWQMASAALGVLGNRVHRGIVLTKLGHSMGGLGDNIEILEADHPVPGERSFAATEAVLEMVSGLESGDLVLFLLSGGGSALFEKPLCPPEELRDLTDKLLACGADIREMNTLRKRLSAVKGGRFAKACEPARVFTVVLSDIVGDPLDMIASGPAYPDSGTGADADRIVQKYGLRLSDAAAALLSEELPKKLDNAETRIIGSVRHLCESAAETARRLGYEPLLLTDRLVCQAAEAGSMLSSIAQTHKETTVSKAFILGGETVVRLTGKGLGGRNQELALSAALGIDGLRDTAVFSVGSDGTDGPTDAAGGYVDGESAARMRAGGVDPASYLADNDSYHALAACGGLIFTGPTGTNVNDLSVLLIKREA